MGSNPLAILTTCIGAYPKPGYISGSHWSEADPSDNDDSEARGFSYVNSQPDTDTVEFLDRATRDAIEDQLECGIDVPTDGEQRR